MNCKYFNLDNGIERMPKRRVNLAVLSHEFFRLKLQTVFLKNRQPFPKEEIPL